MPRRSAEAIDRHPTRVAAMFDRIAPHYDLLNHLLSGGLDWWWRASAVRAARLGGGERVLDLCAGTGDFARAASRARLRPRLIVAADFASAMLVRARAKLARRPPSVPIVLVRADARQLPFGASAFDVVMIGFGIRNVDDIPASARELRRVLAPGGRLVLLEFALPTRGWLRAVFLAYFRHVLPLVGRAVSRHPDAYRYLPESVSMFQSPEELEQILLGAGFQAVDRWPLTAGIVWMHMARLAL